MLDIGQAVIVITDWGVAYPGYVAAGALGDTGGAPAYQIALQGGGQQTQWQQGERRFCAGRNSD